MNGYTYGNNNPLVYADPDGKFFGWLFKALKKAIAIFKKVPNANPGRFRPRAKAPAVSNAKLSGIVQQLYPRKVAKKVFGDGRTSTAIIHEFNTGKPLAGKTEMHIEKGWAAMKGLSGVLERDRKAKETGKEAQNILSDKDLEVAKAEAKRLWDALSSRDVTGNVASAVNANATTKTAIKKNFDAVSKTPAVKNLTGQDFSPATAKKGPVPVAPTHSAARFHQDARIRRRHPVRGPGSLLRPGVRRGQRLLGNVQGHHRSLRKHRLTR
ncbi:hypothetical protein AB0I02_43605 [Streptomyces phaeochromogenes]